MIHAGDVCAPDLPDTREGVHMREDRRLRLDELMIVNPSSSQPEVMFLGEDGALYQVQGLSEEQARQGLGPCVLGHDGFLYQAQGVDAGDLIELDEESGRYFLGADGGLYEIVD